MNEAKIRVGTKIKIIANPNCIYCKIGDIGTIVTGSCFHDGEVKDRDECYWADFKNPEYPNICFTKDTSCFRVLKY